MALFVTLFLAAGPGDSAGQTTSEPKPTAAPPSSAAIPAEEVATRASEATNLLTALSAKFAPSPEIEKIQESLPWVSVQIDEEFAVTADILRQQPMLATLQAQQTHWNRRHLQMVRNHCDLLEGWVYRLLVWTAIVVWVYRSLDRIGLLDPLLSLGSAVLAIKLERGSISISIEDILAFGLTVWAAYLLSACIRFILREEVYPRRGVAHGLSYAYSRLVPTSSWLSASWWRWGCWAWT